MNRTLLAFILILLTTSCIQNENWKQRWHNDTAAQAKVIKDAHHKITELSLELANAKGALFSSSQQIQALSAENEKLSELIENLEPRGQQNAQQTNIIDGLNLLQPKENGLISQKLIFVTHGTPIFKSSNGVEVIKDLRLVQDKDLAQSMDGKVWNVKRIKEMGDKTGDLPPGMKGIYNGNFGPYLRIGKWICKFQINEGDNEIHESQIRSISISSFKSRMNSKLVAALTLHCKSGNAGDAISITFRNSIEGKDMPSETLHQLHQFLIKSCADLALQANMIGNQGEKKQSENE